MRLTKKDLDKAGVQGLSRRATSVKDPVGPSNVNIDSIRIEGVKSSPKAAQSPKKPIKATRPETIAEAIELAENTIGLSFAEINILQTFANTAGDNGKNKGYVGNIFQENIYGLEANSDKGADIAHLGVELKVVPLIRKRNGELTPKERIVANIINYEEEDLSGDFAKSSFYDKNNKSLYVFYEVTDFVNNENNKIVKILYHDLTESEEYQQILDDHKVIIGKISSGNAHKLSGRDTVYLEACTKGSGKGKDLRNQPNNSVQAKQRAYALKTAYVKLLLNK